MITLPTFATLLCVSGAAIILALKDEFPTTVRKVVAYLGAAAVVTGLLIILYLGVPIPGLDKSSAPQVILNAPAEANAWPTITAEQQKNFIAAATLAAGEKYSYMVHGAQSDCISCPLFSTQLANMLTIERGWKREPTGMFFQEPEGTGVLMVVNKTPQAQKAASILKQAFKTLGLTPTINSYDTGDDLVIIHVLKYSN